MLCCPQVCAARAYHQLSSTVPARHRLPPRLCRRAGSPARWRSRLQRGLERKRRSCRRRVISLVSATSKQVRNYREDWSLQVTQPIAGNYYPINLGVYVADGKYELSILVDRAVGASSIQDGQLEIMLHRRLLKDDGRGVGEPLDEVVCVDQECEGLMARGTYYVNVEKLGNGAHWRRTYGQHVYSPFLLAFTHEDESSSKSYNVAKAGMMDANYSLPDNVAIVTLQNLDDGTTLLRLAHLFQAAEDPKYSEVAKVDLKKVFGKRTIKELTETNLSANQKKSEMKKLNWRVSGDTESGPAPVKGGPVDSMALVVELGPMEIRTFLLKF